MRAAKAAIGTHLHASADVYFGVAPKEANRRTVTIRSRLPPCAPLLPLVSSATRRLLNLTRIQSGRPSIHPAFLGHDVERLMESVVMMRRGLERGSAGKPAWIDHGQQDGVDQHPRIGGARCSEKPVAWTFFDHSALAHDHHPYASGRPEPCTRQLLQRDR